MIRSWYVRLLLAFAASAPVGYATAAAINSVRVWSGPESTRVVFELSGAVDHRVFTLTGPDRVVIDLPNTSVGAPLVLPESKGIVTSLRTGGRPGGELRIVLELNHGANPKTFLLAPNEEYGNRLVVDLMQPELPATVRRAAVAPNPAIGRDLVIAIDAGHGGEDPGASGRKGVREKDVVLAIARRLAAEIDNQPGMRSLMIRDGDYFVTHRKRMQIAHDAQADLFISIHADSYRDAVAKGATIYVLSDKGASDEASLRLAKRENASDLIGGVSLGDKDETLRAVLLDLSQSAALSASISAGQRLIKQMAVVTPMRRMQVQQAPFLVLKAPDIPSVLVETAYISNPREEAALRNPEYQAVLARALRAGIVDYFAANPPPASYVAARPVGASPTVASISGASPVAARPAAASRPPSVPARSTTATRPSAPKRHVITRGETLSGIAERYRVSTASLRRSNRLKNDAIRVGQVLTIPPS